MTNVVCAMTPTPSDWNECPVQTVIEAFASQASTGVTDYGVNK